MCMLSLARLRNILLFSIVVVPLWSHSAIIVKIKKNKSFVHLEGEEALPGDFYQALDLYGKPRGILRISKVRNGKAIAIITQGRADINWILEKTENPILASSSNYSNTSFPKNNIGFLTGGYTHIGSKEREQIIIKGLGGTASVLLERFHSPHFSSQLLLGLSYSQLNQNCRDNARKCNTSASSLNMLSLPNILATFFFHINISDNVKAFLGAGAGVSIWHNVNNDLDIITRNNFKKLQPSGHLTLGFNIALSQPQVRIPISITYSEVQAFAEQYQKLVRGNPLSQDHVNLGHFSLQIGIAKDF